MNVHIYSLAIALCFGCVANGTQATEPAGPEESRVGEMAARSVYWGDTHVHSSYSLDANMFNNTRLGPEAAFRFARGEAIDTGGGLVAKLARPLDFLVVSDHAEYMGVFAMIRDGHPLVVNTETGRRVAALLAKNEKLGPEDIGILGRLLNGATLGANREVQRLVWDEVIDIAERMNEPGTFTSLVGYEWGTTPDGNNLHRNVIFRDGPDKTKQVLPFSAIHSDKPEHLWAYLGTYERTTGGQAFAIPHNSNLSNGLMFAVEDSFGRPIDASYAAARAQYEPIVEATQIKGDSEAHPFLSPDDEFADFETWDKTNIFGLAKTERSMLQFSYVRAALKNGLAIQQKVGINPYKLGMIGSTDAHTSLATADDDNFWGKTSNMLLGSARTTGAFIHFPANPKLSTMSWEQAAAGYAAVWADANTREAIFDALRRKEAYSTTGPRMTVRFFGGYTFDEDDANRADLARVGYAKGVPMGGDLPVAPGAPNETNSKAPTFLVAAAKDPVGANLERIQIVKGWVGADGEATERVYDAALAEPGTSGATQLAATWRDPDFDPTALAFYYVRVLEVKTPRWTADDAKRFGSAIAPGTRMEHQERAYTSPIWYTPPR